MHIAQKVNEELERLLRRLRRSTTRNGRQRAAGAGSKVDQDGGDVLYGVEDVDALAAHPAVLAGKLAVVRRVVADAFAEVQRGGPRGAIIVGPGGDRREVARCAVGGTEEGANGAQGPWVEVRLGEGRDDSVAFFGWTDEVFSRWLEARCVVGGQNLNVPSGPQAITLGRLLRPTRAAAMNVRMVGMWYP